MKLKNSLIMNENFTKAINRLTACRIPVTTGFKLLKLVKELEKESKLLEELRISLIKKYGEDKGDGNFSIEPSSENYITFLKEFGEILGQEFEIDLDQKLKIGQNIKDREDKEATFDVTELMFLSEIIDFE